MDSAIVAAAAVLAVALMEAILLRSRQTRARRDISSGDLVLEYLMVGYDSGAMGGGGEFRAYFDDIRFESSTHQINVINGGFESDLYAWTVGDDNLGRQSGSLCFPASI